MPEIIVGALITFLAIFGASELIFKIKNQLMMSKIKNTAIVVACEGHNEEIEYELKSLAVRSEYLKHSGGRVIIIVDRGMDDETRAICKKLEKDIDGVEVCKVSDLPTVFSK